MPRASAATKTLGLRIRIIVKFTRNGRPVDGSDATPPGTGVRCVTRWGERDETGFRFAVINPGPAPDPGLAAAGIVPSRHLTILVELAVPIIV
jgi:hypothetical protein